MNIKSSALVLRSGRQELLGHLLRIVKVRNEGALSLAMLHTCWNISVKRGKERRGMFSPTTITRQLEELNLIKCSLLNDEHIALTDSGQWEALLQNSEDVSALPTPDSALRFQVKCENVPIWFEVNVPDDYGAQESNGLALDGIVSVRGDQITRSEQEGWQRIVKQSSEELGESEYPIFELLVTHLLPQLHASRASDTLDPSNSSQAPELILDMTYHALLTSHHLISPTKRRSLQQWSSQLAVSGFAKVGYPGVIYCQGSQSGVEQFVANVKAMQWLALRLRFVEPPVDDIVEGERKWIELEKVGEVVQEMRRLGRERYVVEMGIGSAGT
ncbi:hypothetical protein BXZ70DRAFT_1009266 [Cristinia sonorae]|uniref:Small nuclear ribonucleoprotein Prp3 C-terminal domain-containing protein n=1 Tax=Cristinia sonorae TaxID=1940300 RepID=A0A8K0UNL9_9AGAR|nr:hypothetical protein BXZ70DRAFT_1009266 [Cristinia sonorae]